MTPNRRFKPIEGAARLCLLSTFLGCTAVPLEAPDTLQTAEQTVLTDHIKYVVVLIKENHTFDNYFTGFPGATSSLTAKLHDGKVITRPIAPTGPLSRDLCHRHSCASDSWAKGAMNGFDLLPANVTDPISGEDDYLSYARFTETQIPNYWAYARTFTLADHYFTTTKGPSFPGHFASVIGYSPYDDNPSCGKPSKCDPALGPCTSCFQKTGVCTATGYDAKTCTITKGVSDCVDPPTVLQALPARVTWAEYGPAGLAAVNHVRSLAKAADHAAHTKPESALLTDIISGNQANIIFAHLEEVSEHPNQDVCPGENNSVRLINAIMNGPHWNETALLLSWDDYGGWYDSVPPPSTTCANGDSFNTGFRVPLIILSPYSRKGFVLKTPTEQASIPRFIEDVYGLPRLSKQDPRNRDSIAGSLLGAFDFTQLPTPALVLKERLCP